MSDSEPETAILFVCMGNICRSPTAHAVFRSRVEAAGLSHRIRIESAGTHDYHVGRSPDRRSMEAARDRGYDLSDLRARQVSWMDFEQFHYLLAMDQANLAILQAQHGGGGSAGPDVRLFLDFHPELQGREVPDPYYGAVNGFEEVLDLVDAGSDALLAHIRERHGL